MVLLLFQVLLCQVTVGDLPTSLPTSKLVLDTFWNLGVGSGAASGAGLVPLVPRRKFHLDWGAHDSWLSVEVHALEYPHKLSI